ncbi:hypothetical protein TNCV_2551111 [Trichonephila clavipes]|nr:hypothetical protein TNCV_2551111 [Trichonephila clavipes]
MARLPAANVLSTYVGYRFIDSRVFAAHCTEDVNGLAVVRSCPNMTFAEERKERNVFFNGRKYHGYSFFPSNVHAMQMEASKKCQ